MLCAQGAIGSILHNQKRGLVLEAKVEYAHNMGMLQVRDRAGLAQKLLLGVRLHAHMEDLDGSRHLSVALFCQVDLSKGPAPEQAEQRVIAKDLSDTISHTQGLVPRWKDASAKTHIQGTRRRFRERVPRT